MRQRRHFPLILNGYFIIEIHLIWKSLLEGSVLGDCDLLQVIVVLETEDLVRYSTTYLDWDVGHVCGNFGDFT